MGLGAGSDWPTLGDLKQRLNLDNEEAERWDGQLQVLLIAAISQIKTKVGDWDNAVDVPDEQLAMAALERAVEMATNDPSVIEARKSEKALYGKRRRFGIA